MRCSHLGVGDYMRAKNGIWNTFYFVSFSKFGTYSAHKVY